MIKKSNLMSDTQLGIISGGANGMMVVNFATEPVTGADGTEYPAGVLLQDLTAVPANEAAYGGGSGHFIITGHNLLPIPGKGLEHALNK